MLLPLGAVTHVEVKWTVRLAEYAGQRSSNCACVCARARLRCGLTPGRCAVMDALSVAQHSLVSKVQSISAKSVCLWALPCLRNTYAVFVGARRSTSRIIFITDLNSDQCNADDPDDAEFLQQVFPTDVFLSAVCF